MSNGVIFSADVKLSNSKWDGEIDYHDNCHDLDRRLVDVPAKSEKTSEITTDFEF